MRFGRLAAGAFYGFDNVIPSHLFKINPLHLKQKISSIICYKRQTKNGQNFIVFATFMQQGFLFPKYQPGKALISAGNTFTKLK